jgi:hypothetical protein
MESRVAIAARLFCRHNAGPLTKIFGCDEVDVYANVNICYRDIDIGRPPVQDRQVAGRPWL